MRVQCNCMLITMKMIRGLATQGREIAVPGLAEPLGEGREIPADCIVLDPAEYEKVVVNGVELSSTSSLAALRSGCAYHGVPQSGGKQSATVKSATIEL